MRVRVAELDGDPTSWAFIFLFLLLLLCSLPWRIVVESDCGAASDPEASVDPPSPPGGDAAELGGGVGVRGRRGGGSVEFGQRAC